MTKLWLKYTVYKPLNIVWQTMADMKDFLSWTADAGASLFYNGPPMDLLCQSLLAALSERCTQGRLSFAELLEHPWVY
jgi:hypothetical protein